VGRRGVEVIVQEKPSEGKGMGGGGEGRVGEA
jgi:hypothetical protein